MSYLFLSAFIAGLLLAVRLMFFGAERKRRLPGALPLRRWEPAAVGFLLAFGITGYLLTQHGGMRLSAAVVVALIIAAISAVSVTRLAIATARLQPEHDPDDPRYILQGRVGVVTVDIPAGGEGVIRYEDVGSTSVSRARDIGGGALAAGQEICIERLEDGVAYVELWALVEARL